MKNKKIATSMLLAFCAVMSVAPSALARSSAAGLGLPYHGSQAHCFNAEAAGAHNVCNELATWVMPIVYDNAGYANISVSARSSLYTPNRVQCRAYSISGTGTDVRIGSSAQTTYGAGHFEWLTVGVSAHGWGSTWVSCDMDPTTHVLSYHWNL